MLVKMTWCQDLLAVLMALGLMISGCGSEQEAPPPATRPVKTLLLEKAAQAYHRSFPGKVQPIQQVDLAFRISGPLIEFPVMQGEQMKKGQLIARIDPRDFETALAEVQSRLSEAQAQLLAMQTGARPEDLRVLEAEVEAAKANYRTAEQEFRRYASLYSQKAATKSEYDRYRRSRDVAQAQYNTSLQNLEKGRKGAREEDIKAQEARIQGLEAQIRQARNALDDTSLKAPFDGIVATKYVDNFQEVQAKQPIIKYQDLSWVEIVINVPERLILMAGRASDIESSAVFDALPERKFKLTLTEFSTQSDPLTQTYAVTLKMPYPEGLSVLAGMTAQVTLSWTEKAQKKDNIFQVPVEAVMADETGKSYVWIVDPKEMTVHKSQVQVGEMSGNSLITLSGIKAGDRIVTAGVNYLMEGQKVRLLEDRQTGDQQ